MSQYLEDLKKYPETNDDDRDHSENSQRTFDRQGRSKQLDKEKQLDKGAVDQKSFVDFLSGVVPKFYQDFVQTTDKIRKRNVFKKFTKFFPDKFKRFFSGKNSKQAIFENDLTNNLSIDEKIIEQGIGEQIKEATETTSIVIDKLREAGIDRAVEMPLKDLLQIMKQLVPYSSSDRLINSLKTWQIIIDVLSSAAERENKKQGEHWLFIEKAKETFQITGKIIEKFFSGRKKHLPPYLFTPEQIKLGIRNEVEQETGLDIKTKSKILKIVNLLFDNPHVSLPPENWQQYNQQVIAGLRNIFGETLRGVKEAYLSAKKVESLGDRIVFLTPGRELDVLRNIFLKQSINPAAGKLFEVITDLVRS